MYKLVGCDTDSIKICRIDGQKMSFDEMNFILKKMNDITPELINLEEDGYYEKFIVLKSKNYIYYDGKEITYKGSSLKDQKKEYALQEMLKKFINALINDNWEQIPQIYRDYIHELFNIQDINRWTVKKTITKAVLEKDDTLQAKVRAAIGNRHIQEGDKVWLYNAVAGMKQKMDKGTPLFYKRTGEPQMEPNRILKHVDDWNGELDIEHYLGRIYDTAMIMENVIDKTLFKNYSLKKHKQELKELYL